MTRRVLLIAGAVIYLASFLVGTVLFFQVEGSFGVGSRLFWAWTGLPAVILLAHLAAGVLLLWKPDRAAPAVLAVELLMLGATVAGSLQFWATFRWLLLAEAARLAVAGMIIYSLWWPLAADRALALVCGGAGLIVGVVWTLTVGPPAEAAQPLLPRGVGVTRVWPLPPGPSSTDDPIWKAGVALGDGGRVAVRTSPPLVEITYDTVTFVLQPVMAFPRVSLDGLPLTKLNGAGMRFRTGVNPIAWDADGMHYAYVRYNAIQAGQSRLAATAASHLSTIAAADMYVRGDPTTHAVEVVSLVHLEAPLAVHRTDLFDLAVVPALGATVRLPPVGSVSFEGDRDPRMLNLQRDGAVLYRTGPELAEPLVPAAKAETFDGYFVVEGLPDDRALVVVCPDWQTQALRTVSPAAGDSVCANDLVVSMADDTWAAQTAGAGAADTLDIAASVASTAAGKGRPAVRMAAGTYVNRMVMVVVPRQDDYTDVARRLVPWPLPKWARTAQ